MEEYNYTYKGSEDYCYPGTTVLKNKLGLKDDDVLLKAERETGSRHLISPMSVLLPVPGIEAEIHSVDVCVANSRRLLSPRIARPVAQRRGAPCGIL
jgi:hypothetical protein